MNTNPDLERERSPENLVSVIIPVFNGGRYLAEAIDSVLAQTYQPVEVIVVDDGSTDNSADIAHSYNDVHYIYQRNQGVAVARNTGLAAAHGAFIAFLDADDTWPPYKLKTQVDYLLQHPFIGYTIARIKNIVEPGVKYPPLVMQHILKEDQIGLATIVARNEVFDSVGGFDPRFGVAEDFEWFSRAKDADILLAILPDVLLLRRIHDANISLARFEEVAAKRLLIFKESIQRKRNKERSHDAE
jgi:glycosyltransferase involved in cell wall biosynthesis